MGNSRTLPEGWEWKRLGDLVEKNQLLMKSGFPCGNNNMEKKGIPQLRLMNIDNSGQIDLNSLKSVETEKNLTGYFLRDNDVIFNNTNSGELVGKTAVWSDKSTRYVLSNHMTILRFSDKSGVDPHFLARYFHLLWLNRYFEQIRQQHVNQSSVSLERLREIKIPLPLQQKFARIVEKIESMRQSQNQSKQQIEDLFSALMQKAFRGELDKSIYV